MVTLKVSSRCLLRSMCFTILRYFSNNNIENTRPMSLFVS